MDETGGGFRPKAIDLADKVGACLLYVRQNCSWDALSHLVNISPETMRVCFYEFIEWISVDKFHEEVYFPPNAAERDRIESCYAQAGFPGQNPLFRDAEYMLKDIEGNDVIEIGRLANTPPALCSRRIESVRKDAEDTFSHVKNAFAIFEGPVRFSNPTQITNMVRTLLYLHNRRARSLMHHEVGQVDGDWKPSRRMMDYVPTPVDLEFARKIREGVVDGVAGRAQYIANERRVEDRKKNWADRRTRLAQHITYKDSRRELK
ncbi:unnamed protein product [Bathycoccus prasinos]